LTVSIHAFRGEGDRRRRRSDSGRSPVSIHAFRGEGDVTPIASAKTLTFQSTPSGGKATDLPAPVLADAPVSIHAFRGEGDLSSGLTRWSRFGFNPRLPGGRRPSAAASVARASKFQSTPSGGKATCCHDPSASPIQFQSTPSGGKATKYADRMFRAIRGFNPRLPGGRRPYSFLSYSIEHQFQSTPSGGKATMLSRSECKPDPVSIHAFRGEGDTTILSIGCNTVVSIHAFRGEGDWTRADGRATALCFNPRLPGGRRHLQPVRAGSHGTVSIHAFRGEGDLQNQRSAIRDDSFNPRLPGGRRLRRLRYLAAW